MHGFPVPDPAGLPAPIWILKVLSVLTLSFHLIAMNLLVGGVLLLAYLGRRRLTDALAGRMYERLARALPVTMSLTITLGVAPLLFVQVIYGQAFYTSSALMAWPWIKVIPAVIVAYYGLYICQFRPQWLGGLINPIAWLSALLILIVGFLFASNWTLMLVPRVWHPLYNSGMSGMHLYMGDPALVPRYLHFMVGGAAVAGLGILFLGSLSRKDDPELAERMKSIGTRWFLWASMAQIIVGLWFLFALPRGVRGVFLGGNAFDTIVLGAGILLALVAMVLVRRLPVASAALIGLTVGLMVVVRHRVRQIMLDPLLGINKQTVNPQMVMLVVFVVVLLAGLATVWWMVRAFARSGAQPEDAGAADG